MITDFAGIGCDHSWKTQVASPKYEKRPLHPDCLASGRDQQDSARGHLCVYDGALRSLWPCVMDDPTSENKKLVDIRFIRQQRGILEREEQAAALIQSVGEDLVAALNEKLDRTGRADLLPRALAYAINHASGAKDPARTTIGNRVANNTVDFVVAMDLGPKSDAFLTLHRHLSRHGSTIEKPAQFLVTIPNYGADLIEAAVVADQSKFKAFVLSSPDSSFLICIDKNSGRLDLHLRELQCSLTGVAVPLQQCQGLGNRAHLIKSGLLAHMAHDGELSLASRDAGYLCSVWMDDDVAGGWISTRVYLRYDALDYVRFVLDDLVRQTTQKPGKGRRLKGK